MPKKEISYEIRNKEEKVSSNTIGILQDNILKYKEKDKESKRKCRKRKVI